MRATGTDALVAAFERLVARSPGAALTLEEQGRFTASAVDALARRLETALRGARLDAGAPVGLVAPNGAGFLAALLAARRAGHVPVLLDERATPAEQARASDELGLAALWRVDASGVDPTSRIEHGRLGDGWQPLPPGTAVVKLTSGSSGQARGVAIAAEALLADDAALRSTMGIEQHDRLLAMVPFSHSYGLSSLVMPAIAGGITLVVPPRADPFGSLRVAARAGATILPTVPAYLSALLRPPDPPSLPSSLRLVLSAGAPLLPETARRFRERFGRRVHVFYGASECGGISFDADGAAAEQGTVGTPVRGVRVDLVEVAGLEPVVGRRVVVSSPAVGIGYWPQPDARLAAGRFISEDLAFERHGQLALAGRLDELINVRGRKVSPAEVERVIGELESVCDVLVQAAPDPTCGGEVVRAIVACPGGSLTAEAVRQWCCERLSPHKVPRSVILVSELPRTIRGKIDRTALRRLGAELAPRDESFV